MTWFPSWLVDLCTFLGAVLLADLLILAVLCVPAGVLRRVRRFRAKRVVIQAAERFTREAVQ